ncbi:HEPN domain-containing protein [Psychrobacillus sp. FSL H8-0484]|uniref:ApeA N-terminal domain 1-containing protein n=1 Tax=Psychrobacillus sp. FSL H8-0484 TaxID=2921390 RepID=UPI0030F74058
MSKDNGIQYGKWKVMGCDTWLNGILEINHKEKIYLLKLYSEEAIELPYFSSVVYGKTHKGTSFTLVDCSVGQSVSMSFGNNYSNRYEIIIRSRYVLEDVLFKKSEDILVTEVYFKLSNMDIWAHQEAIEIEFDKEKGHLITAKTLKNIDCKHEDFLFSVVYYVEPDYGSQYSHEFKINTVCQFKLEFNKPTPLENTLNIINQVRDFLTLCTSNRTYIEKVIASPILDDQAEFTLPFVVYGPGIEIGTLENIPKLRFVDITIRLDKIVNNFERCMQNWFSKNELLLPVIELYIGINYQRTSNERHFLNAVQALEAYHRLTRKNEVLPKIEHKVKIKSIISSVPEEDRAWLQGKLNFSNEPSLHERLDDLLRPVKDTSHPNYSRSYDLFKPQGINFEDLIKDIKNTRNYNTHFDEKLKNKAVKGDELLQLTTLLIIMIEYYLMTELELNEDLVLDITNDKVMKISNHRSYLKALHNTTMNRKR